MKTTAKFFTVLVILLILFGCPAVEKVEKVEVGQVWKYESKNPFNKFSYIATVTEIKEGYVNYKKVYDWESPDSTRTDSTHLSIFKIGMERLESTDPESSK